jgi:NAD(P)-dependent dehydrogenase (short-subunit alcohol dehydrogenase family)
VADVTDQYTFQDPTTQYPKPDDSWKQEQPGAGLEQRMNPTPDDGESTYRGSGRLTGRKAVVTGADSGIGRAAVIAFAREGADIVLSYLPEEEDDAKEVVRLVEEAGRKAVACPGDLTDEAYCQALVQTAVDELGGIDLLANVAGKQQNQASILDITTEQFDQTYRTNVYAMFWLCKAAVQHMPPGSTIINTTSIQAYEPSPILVDYASTKAAINSFTKGLAAQLAEKGIRVNAIAPGPTLTGLTRASYADPERRRATIAQIPLGRMGEPDDIVGAILYLASDESRWVTGSTVTVDGGYLVQ